MLRSPTLPLAEYDDSSSLDPLTDLVIDSNSPTYQSYPQATRNRSSPIRTRPACSVKAAVPRASTSLDLTGGSSPLKSITEHALSPWKIKVTVEAEPEEMQEDNLKSVAKLKKVPLRRDSSPREEETNRSDRGRSRAGGRASKRNDTPVRGRSNSRSRRQSVTDLDIVVLGDEGESNEWSPRKSSRRKSSKIASPTKKTNASKKPGLQINGKEGDCDVSAHGVDVREDTDADGPGLEDVEKESPELRDIDLNRVSVRARSGSTKLPASNVVTKGKLHTDTRSRERTVSGTSAMSYPTPSPTSSYHGDSDQPDKPIILATETEEFNTMLESEGFTMIDVDSLPSVQKYLSSPIILDDANQPEAAGKEGLDVRNGDDDVFESRESSSREQEQSLEHEGDISSTVPSSPPAASTDHLLVPKETQRPVARRQITPQVLSSPRLPSPPRPPPRSTEKSALKSDRKAVARAVDAGTALNDAVVFQNMPKVSKFEERGTRSEIPKHQVDPVFGGFDSRTQRDLRAGLRFGEELARRQRSRSPGSSGKASDIAARNNSTTRKTDSSPVTANSVQGQSKLEQRWQLELEEVSQQIQNADHSQVVVIDNEDEGIESTSQLNEHDPLNISADEDDEAGNETEADPWLALASSPSTKKSRKVERQDAPGQHVTCLPEPKPLPPRRVSIPSPWKRGEGYEASTFLSNGDMSGMLWQPEKKDIRFGAGDIRRMRRSGTFDIDRMMGRKNIDAVDVDEEPGPTAQHDDSGIENSITEDDEVPTKEQSGVDEDETYGSITSDTTVSQPSPVKIPVNFNDSTITGGSTDLLLPQPASREASVESQDVPGPPTPRSAMKGTRLSLGLASERTDAATGRKVLFSEKSRWLDHRGVEGELAVQTASPELIRSQSSLDQQQPPIPVPEKRPKWSVQKAFPDPTQDELEQDKEDSTQPSKGILSWFWGTKPEKATSAKSSPLEPTHSPVPDAPSPVSNDQPWQPAKSSIPSTATRCHQPPPASTIPTYLLPPSYPTDPSRNPSTHPLSTSGPWTKPHLKTLHILYRKSLRPRFHTPSSTRPDITRHIGTEVKIDESRAGLGEFVFEFRRQEALVVERFMQEVEWDCVRGEARWREEKERVEDMKDVSWGWKVEEIVERLARVVVGEVIRAEEGRRVL